jgi:hypothetical protein
MPRMHAVAIALQLTVAVSAAATTLDTATVRGATTEAARIWQPHVSIAFVAADAATAAPDLFVVITDMAFAATGADAAGIGQIRFSEPGRPMNTIYLSVTGARRLAEGAKWKGLALEQTPARVRRTFLTHALGRALAHELGHFLLRSTAHSSRGLMRARYLTPELLDDNLRPYALTGAQAAELNRVQTPKNADARPISPAVVR